MRKDLIREIEELLPTFSKGQKTIANYLIHNYDKAAYLTASKLGREVGVSESTVVRFAIELGFDGYPGLQHTLQEIIRTRLTTKQRMEVTNTRIGNGDILNSVLESDIDNIRPDAGRDQPCGFFGGCAQDHRREEYLYYRYAFLKRAG